jgi:hypothetical protein
MIAKEKALEIFSKHYVSIFNINCDYSEECLISNLSQKHAIITVDEIIAVKLLWHQKDTNDLDYWNEVKQEIQKL